MMALAIGIAVGISAVVLLWQWWHRLCLNPAERRIRSLKAPGSGRKPR